MVKVELIARDSSPVAAFAEKSGAFSGEAATAEIALT